MTAAVHIANAVLLAGLIIGSALAWSELPAEIPGHFGPDGQPTRWDERSLLGWFSLPVLAGLLTAMNYGFAAAVDRWPKLVNLPDRERFLKLPAAHRGPVLAIVRELLYSINILLTLTFALIQYGGLQAAHGEASQGYIIAALVMAMLITPLIAVGWLPRVQSALHRAEEAARADPSGPA